MNLIIALLVIVGSPVNAQWGKRDNKSTTDVLVGLGKQFAGAALLKHADRALNPVKKIEPVRSGEDLGEAVVSVTNCSWYYGSQDAFPVMVECATSDAGFRILSRDGREAVKREMRETRSPEFNQTTALSLGTLVGARFMIIASVRQGRGPAQRIQINERGVRIATDAREVWAHVTLRLNDRTGAISLRPVEFEASDATTDVSAVIGRWGKGIQFGSRHDPRQDRAVVAATVLAANELGRQMAEWQRVHPFDPQTGLVVGALVCGHCKKGVHREDKFCSSCGFELQWGEQSAPMAEDEFAPQFVGKGEE